MFTRCQHCHTWFRIGSADVRVAHGQVRCGFCGEEFNALKTLCDTLPADAANAGDSAAGQIELDYEADAPLPVDTTESIPADAEDAIAEIESADAGTAEIEAVTAPAEPAAPGDAEAIASAAELPSADVAASSAVAERAGLHRRRRQPPAQSPRPPRRWPAVVAWGFGCLILLFGLAAQVVLYEHEALRDNPVTRSAIEALYAAFGHPLPPRRDLAALTISQAEVTSAPDTAGALLVTAALTNRADFAQPYPLLRVSLTNRFDKVIGEGLFKPRDYLRQASKTTLAAGETQAVRLRIVDPGTTAVGFKVVPCAAVSGGTRCAAATNKNTNGE
ncbi:MAG TPA: zinc-ribbon and DUF3426 domain-containing protein [Gammaproteobacteria bacterium]|nr:zinc-ribbon and DUF3426 domain-containing protein [Gammaproteobacteria bacterium]